METLQKQRTSRAAKRLETASILIDRPRILLVDDSAPWRCTVRSVLRNHAELEFVGEVEDGTEAIEQARELKPDLILLDIALIRMNGIEAAKRIRQVAPNVAILFLSTNRDVGVVLATLRTGAQGYVLKTDAGSELWPAIEAILDGKQYFSTGVADCTRTELSAMFAN